MERNEKHYDRFLGFDHKGNLIFLNYTFGDPTTENFHGATGYKLEPWTQAQVNARIEDPDFKYTYEDMWRDDVAAERTLLSFEEWYNEYAQDVDRYELAGLDKSFYPNPTVKDKVHELVPDAVTTNAVTCGRIFPEALDDIDMTKPYDAEAIAITRTAEQRN